MMMKSSPTKRRRLYKKAKESLATYMDKTTIHGCWYIVSGGLLERLAWVIFTLFGFVCSGYIFITAFQYWEEHPVQTTIDEVGLPVHDLTFPAVTICDTASLKMPRKNRWMFIETLLNSMELVSPKEELKNMYPGETFKNIVF